MLLSFLIPMMFRRPRTTPALSTMSDLTRTTPALSESLTGLKIVKVTPSFVVVEKPPDLRSVPSFGPSDDLLDRYEARSDEEFKKTRRARFDEIASQTTLLPPKLRSAPLPRTKAKFLKHCTSRVGGKLRMSSDDALIAWDEISLRVKELEKLEGLEESDCVLNRIRRAFGDACPVHRLDMATSGLLCVAVDSNAAANLASQWAARTVEKKYLAVARGKLGAHGVIDFPLARVPKVRKDQVTRMTVSSSPNDSKPCLTEYVLRSYDSLNDVSLLDLTPHTGRLHQLRAHLAAIGHPILGDDIYGYERPHGDEYQCLSIREHKHPELSPRYSPLLRLCLHASHLAFDDPVTGERCSLSSCHPDFLASFSTFEAA